MRLPILMYHKIDRLPPGVRYPRNYVLPDQFAAQLAALKRWGYETISFGDWLAYCRGELRLPRRLPRRPIILTFDDGYRSTYEIAWPLLQRHGCGATVFLVSELIGKTNVWDVDEIQEPLLGTAEIAELQAGGVEFGSHTMTHAPLTTISRQHAVEELRGSRAALQRLLGEPVRVLCYPYGKQTAATRALAREAGYEAAVIARRRLNSPSSDPLRLTRLRMEPSTRLDTLRWTLAQLRWLWWT
jgi:peptidoglycan/xylan/chitin deacetylase (PgdA/CDA1 family)